MGEFDPGVAAPQGSISSGYHSAAFLVGAGFALAARSWAQRGRITTGPNRRQADVVVRTIELRALPKEDVPARLKPEFYFDFQAHPFAHMELLTSAHDVVEVLGSIHDYTMKWLEDAWCRGRGPGLAEDALRQRGARLVGRCPQVRIEAEDGQTVFSPDVIVSPVGDAIAGGLRVGGGAKVLGGTFDLRAGGVWLGGGVTIEPGTYIAGPVIIGSSTLRFGAYLRGDVIVGDGVVLRGELKNSIVMDHAELAHPGYTGDSIIGYKGHFGCQALSANLGLFGAELYATLSPDCVGAGITRVALGRRKVGLVLGDGSQLGCGTVSAPATFVGPRTHVYPLTPLGPGFYGPDEIVKNRPEASGTIVRAKLLP